MTSGVGQLCAAWDAQLQAQQQQQCTAKRPNGLVVPNVSIMPYRNKDSGEKSPVELTPTPEEQLLGTLLEANRFAGTPDKVNLMTLTSSLVKMTQLYPTRPQKPSPDPKTEAVSRSVVVYGTEHVVSHGDTGQYNRDGTGASACRLTALNFARIVFSMERSGLQDTALLQAMLARECVEVRQLYTHLPIRPA